MMFDPKESFYQNMLRFREAAEGIDRECAQIFFRHIAVLATDQPGVDNCSALTQFGDLVCADLQSLVMPDREGISS
jgi:hypothetical protein